MPKISVIIPTYNRECCVLNAVKCVLQQTIQPMEILVIDDGSTDNTENILAKLPATVKYVKKENGGVSSARNLGIKLAKGDWIAFLDSDDYWLPNKLERQIECLTKTETLICFTGISKEDGTRVDGIEEMDPLLSQGAFGKYQKSIELIAKTIYHPMVQTLLIKKALLKQLNGFNENLYVAEDTALFYELLANYEVSFVNSPLAKLTRQRSLPGLSNSRNLDLTVKRFDCYIQVQAMAYAYLLAKSFDSTDIFFAIRTTRERIAYFISRRAELAHVQKKHDLGISFAKEALALTSNLKVFLRCLVLAYCPMLLNKRLNRKWQT